MKPCHYSTHSAGCDWDFVCAVLGVTAKGWLQVRRLSGEEAWRGCIELRKRKDHFIYTLQSTGVLRPEQLFTRAIDILVAKCDRLLEHL